MILPGTKLQKAAFHWLFSALHLFVALFSLSPFLGLFTAYTYFKHDNLASIQYVFEGETVW